tara:strand:+ start:18591 stop:18935 length:345 start_codon:yes stop_codon:yes gene_type:complete
MIKRSSDNRIIVSNKKILKNMFTQGTGLMFKRGIKDIGYVFVFKKEHIIGITMLFVFFPVDVLFLDSEKKVVEIVQNLRPFRNYWPKQKAKYVIELPKGTAYQKDIHIRDELKF